MNKSAMIMALIYSVTSVSCTPTDPYKKKDCDPSLLPYQYQAHTDVDRYFVTLIPTESEDNEQTFFLSETSRPLKDRQTIIGGDPTGWIVEFQQTAIGVKADELGLSLPLSKSTYRAEQTGQLDEIIHFRAGKVKYSLVSCDGIFSPRFKSDFSHLFD